MKKLAIVMILFVLLPVVFVRLNSCPAQSTNLPDTIVLKTKQVKGPGLMYYLININDLNFEIKDSLKYDVILPDGITDIKLASETADYNSAAYRRTTKDPGGFYHALIAGKKIDTAHLLTIKENSVCFLKGVKGKDTILIVDENHNMDFRDDQIRPIEEIDFRATDKLFKCDFTIFNGEKYVTASNWITIGSWRKEGIWYLTNQHYTSKFKLQKSTYDIELFISDARFWFDKPQIALIGANGTKRDTVLEGDILNIGEYLKLKEGIYKFADLTNDGSYITLVREDHYQERTGTQIGVIAPAFKCHTTDGDSISLEDYKGSNVLLVNISSCYSVPASQVVYKDLSEKYESKLDMVVIDRGAGLLNQLESWNLSGKFVNAHTSDNASFAKNYRPDVCSRTCFLIGADGRVIDKFEIFDWEKTLSKHFR